MSWFNKKVSDVDFRTTTKLLSEMIGVNTQDIQELKDTRRESEICRAIGKSLPMEYDDDSKLIELLNEARERGYFDKDKVWNTVKNNTPDGGYYKHSESDVLSSYWYYVDNDSLHIPMIGVLDTFSSGTIQIYEKGEWGWIGTKEEAEKRRGDFEKEQSKLIITRITSRGDGKTQEIITNRGTYFIVSDKDNQALGSIWKGFPFKQDSIRIIADIVEFKKELRKALKKYKKLTESRLLDTQILLKNE